MKVGVYLIQDISPSAGGNFSYYERLINAIDCYHFDKPLEVCYVGRFPQKKIGLQKEYVQLVPKFFYRFFQILGKIGITKLISRIFFFNADLCSRLDHSRLCRNGVDVLLYPKQFFKEVENFPFMTMNWDAGHKSTFMFPEFTEGFEVRENWYKVEMQRALAVIVESQGSKKEFAEFFAIPNSKIEIVPIFPGGVVDLVVDLKTQQSALQKFGLNQSGYFFYPAQFWAHKNHYNLILAFESLLLESGRNDIKLVFTGSDKGNKDHILSIIKSHKLENKILIFGFVSNEEVYTLYKNAIALVMPTFLGPTNMPVLEAQALETPVICSDLSGHRETCGDGALYADPAVASQWTAAMYALLDGPTRQALLTRAKTVKSTSAFNIVQAIKSLEEIFLKFIPIRGTFK